VSSRDRRATIPRAVPEVVAVIFGISSACGLEVDPEDVDTVVSGGRATDVAARPPNWSEVPPTSP